MRPEDCDIIQPPSVGLKFDQDKDPWHLAPYSAFGLVVKVLAYGARKYEPRNWEKGINFSRLFASTQRHLVAWFNREENDPETGLSHLAHAACGILFLISYQLWGMEEFDDRP
jgi:hypothetical protein